MSQKKYPLLTGNRDETRRYYHSRSEQLNLSIFNLESHTLHLKIVCQTPEIQACKIKIYSAPKTRGFVKGPSPDLISQAYCKRIRTLTFSFSFEKNYTLKCFNCSTDNYSFEESICALHSIPSVKKEEKSTRTVHFGDVARLLRLIHTGLFGSLGSCRKTKKTRRRVLSPLPFGFSA